MGTAFRIITGNSSGFYSLDLSKDEDRRCGERIRSLLDMCEMTWIGKMLAQQSNLERSKRGACGHIDTSQYGDDEYFRYKWWKSATFVDEIHRNETSNGRPFRLSTNYFLDMPQVNNNNCQYTHIIFCIDWKTEIWLCECGKVLLRTLYVAG